MDKYDIEKDFLPVGSVVSVRFNEGKFMIVGFCTVEGETKKMYDYCAVPYPSGLGSLDNMAMINRKIIKKVHHIGYETEEDKAFKEKLNEAIVNKRYKNIEEVK